VYIPTANQGFGNVPGVAALRIKSVGLVQGAGGSGESVSLIWKSPAGESKTPTVAVLNWGGSGIAIVGRSQIRVAMTEGRGVGGCPAKFPPPKTKPFPVTVMPPFECTVAMRLLITQIWPAGCTPRTILKTTCGEVDEGGETVSSGSVKQGPDEAQPVTDETGWTPIPPLNCNVVDPADAAAVCAAAGSDQTTPSNIVHAKTFFMIPPPYKPGFPVALIQTRSLA
jgi:hypothetical protein